MLNDFSSLLTSSRTTSSDSVKYKKMMNFEKIAYLLVGFFISVAYSRDDSLVHHRDKRNIYLNSKSPILIGKLNKPT